MAHPDDRIIWPDGTECLRCEMAEYTHMSDDYKVVEVGSPYYDEDASDLLGLSPDKE